MLRYATPLVFAAVGGMFSERSGVVNIGLEGMMLMGAFFAILAADKLDSWPLGILAAAVAGGLTALIHAFVSISLRADQIVSGTAINFLALGVTGYFFIDVYGDQGHSGRGDPAHPHAVNLDFLSSILNRDVPRGRLRKPEPDGLAQLVLLIVSVLRDSSPAGLRLPRGRRAPARRGHRRHLRLYHSVCLRRHLGHARRTGGVHLSIGFLGSFNENMTAGRGFIALAALIFGNWRPLDSLVRRCLRLPRARWRRGCPSTRPPGPSSSRRSRTC
jgi:simple sugar transport system permease protein